MSKPAIAALPGPDTEGRGPQAHDLLALPGGRDTTKFIRDATSATLGESPEGIPGEQIHELKQFLAGQKAELSAGEDGEYKAARDQVERLMAGYKAKGILIKDGKFYKGSPDYDTEGDQIVVVFREILSELGRRRQLWIESHPSTPQPEPAAKPAPTKAEAHKKGPDHTRGPEARKDRRPDSAPEAGKVYPLTFEIEGQTFQTLGKALAYGNLHLKDTAADSFAKECQRLYEANIDGINELIASATTQIEETNSIDTNDDGKGIADIMEPLVTKGIFIHEGFYYYPNTDVDADAKRVLGDDGVIKLERAVNAKIIKIIEWRINQAIEQIRETWRIATNDTNEAIGIIDIMKPFVAKDIVRRTGTGPYRPNPSIKRASNLADAANNQIRTIEEKEAARRKAYDQVASNGFRYLDRKNGFAYRIHLEEPRKGLRTIVLDEVVPQALGVAPEAEGKKIGSGMRFDYYDADTPKFLIKAADASLEPSGKK